MLNKVFQKKKLTFTFETRLYQKDMPPPGAVWMADSSQYPKVTYSSQDKFLFLV